VLIASEPVWCGERDWVGTDRRNAAAPENRSTTLFPDGIPLVCGRVLLLRTLMKKAAAGTTWV